ncbi:hypothetical protein KKA08_09690, partial [bacterium]|nr:hypothetical protein [bacterium]
GRAVDDRIEFGLTADLYIRKFKQETEVGPNPGSGGTDIQTEIEYSMYALPIMAQLTVNIMPQAIVIPYAAVAVGYEMVYSSESNYELDETDRRFYGGFGWQLAIGGKYYIGSSSALFGELFYNGATVKRNKGSNEAGFPVSEELDFSGLGFRVGIWLGGF